MKIIVQTGRTSLLVRIFIQDSTSTTGAGKTGLTSATSGLTCYRARDDDGNAGATQISLSAGTRGTWSSGGFVEKDSTNMPGWYEFGVPNNAIAAGSETVDIEFKGATGMAPCNLEIQLVAYNPQDGVRLGLTALPNAAAEAAGGLYTRGSGAGQINQAANGQIDVNVKTWIGGTIPAVNVTGVPKVDVVDWLGSAPNALTGGRVDSSTGAWNGTAVASTNTAGVPVVDTRQVIRQGTAQSTGNSTTAIKLDSGASSTTNFYKYHRITVISGTGAPQSAICTAYDGTTKIATVSPAWPTAPDNTSVFQITVDSQADLETWEGTAPNALVSGRVDASIGANNAGNLTADVQKWLGGTIPAPNVTGVPKIDVVDWLGSTPNVLVSGRVDASIGANNAGNLTADVQKWLSGTIPAPNVTGVPKVDLVDWLGSAPNVLISGRVDASIGAQGLANLTANVQQWSGTNVASPNTAGVPIVDTREVLRQGTAQATGNTTTTIKLDASASATDSYYNGFLVMIISGTGAPQISTIIGYVGSTKIATVFPAFPTAPDNTSVFQLLPGITQADAIFTRQIGDGYTWQNHVLGTSAAVMGKASGFPTATDIYRSLDDTKDRVTATTDADGNRTAVTYNLSP